MRISDWSSDVCSSDHLSLPHRENLLQAEIDPNMISRAVGVIVLVGDGIFAEFRVKLVKVRRSCITIHDAIADFVTAAFLLPACDPHSSRNKLCPLIGSLPASSCADNRLSPAKDRKS